MPKNYCIMQIWAESGKSALPICNYSQILYQFLTFTQNLKRSPRPLHGGCDVYSVELLFNLSCRLSPIGINLQGPILC